MKTVLAFLALLLPAMPVAAQGIDVTFSEAPTANCVAAAGTAEAKLACAGTSAQACMDTPSGGTTSGIGACLDRERAWWDAQLNANYKTAMAQAKATDADMKAMGGRDFKVAENLRQMQRQWIAFRDAKCDYVMAQWTDGSGAGPAWVGCMMQTTAEQAVFLIPEQN